MQCVKIYSTEEFKMQNSSPDTDPAIIYNDSGYFTNHQPQSFSSNSNSEPSFEEVSLHSKNGECSMQSGVYFCEDAVFDEPKLEGPPLLCDNTNTYEQFSSLNKFSLEKSSDSYLNNVNSSASNSTNVLQYFDDSLSSLSSINPSQPICVSDNRQNIISQAVEQCLTINSSQTSVNNTVEVCSPTKNYINPVDPNFSSEKNFISQAVEQCLTINSSQSSVNNTVEVCSSTKNYINAVNSNLSSEKNVISQAVEQCLTINSSQTSVNNTVEVCSSTKNYINPVNSNLSSEKNISQAVEQFLTINSSQTSANNIVEVRTPTKNYINPVNPNLSPELFSEDENDEQIVEIETSITENISFSQKHSSPNEQFLKNDRKLLKRVQETLSGVPPPPSVTILQLSINEMLEKIYSNKDLFLSAKASDTNLNNECSVSNSVVEEKSVKSLLISSTKEEVEHCEWPEVMNYRFHGLYHNRSKLSEDLEESCTRYLTRYVGAETASLCTWSLSAPGSASKRRAARLRWAPRSPGRRLSHLARRRITFSSASLHQQQAQGGMSVMGNSAVSRQIMIDPRRPSQQNRRRSPRKSPRKSPWKKSPRKSPRKTLKTPNSSAKKRSARRMNLEDDSKPGSSKMSSTKRALFQSPEQKVDRKRKRSDDDVQMSCKFPRSLSMDVNHLNLSSATSSGVGMQRRNSEVVRSVGREGLSDLHKQKMLWAVSEALRAQQISMTHPQFRGYASILCKIIKHLVPDLMSNGPRQPGSTSDRMLRIARHHSYSVTRGKSYEEIIIQIKETNANLKNLKPPSGYIAPETTKSQTKNVLQDKVMNIESNNPKKSPEMKTGRGENSKLKSIRRQIVFDDNEITKTCNSDR